MKLETINRRQAIAATGVLACSAALGREAFQRTKICTLGFGAYGLPNMTTEQAIDAVAAAGYDSVELYVLADRDLDAASVSKARRGELSKRLTDKGLKLTSLMENLRPADSEARHKSDLERLKAACQLANDLSPDAPPAVQTVLGGKKWEDMRKLCVQRLPAWADIGHQHKVTVAVKPHRGNAMNTPAHADWLLNEIGRPGYLRMWFDYSHFAFRDLPMEDMVKQSVAITAGVAVKDAVKVKDRVTFALPGKAGTIDYAKLLRLLYVHGYRGDICVEVSSAVWKQPGYDANAALKDCYDHLATAFERAKVPRPKT